ncbi:MAG: GyrI-like domain-containing protein [Candidatus Paceibacterota bacterium]
MEYIKKEIGKIKLVGMGIDTSTQNAPGDCPPLWQSFMSKISEIENVIENKTYGVSFTISQAECTFRYIAGIEVSEFGNIKEGFEVKEIPASTYLIFTHKGKLNTLGETYSEIMKEIENAGYKQEETFWIECYDERWKSDSDDAVFEIWVPIK